MGLRVGYVSPTRNQNFAITAPESTVPFFQSGIIADCIYLYDCTLIVQDKVFQSGIIADCIYLFDCTLIV